MDNTDEEEQGDVIHEIELLQLDKGRNIEAVGFFYELQPMGTS